MAIDALKRLDFYEKAKGIIVYHLEYVDKESSYLLPGIFQIDNVAVDLDPEFLTRVVSTKQSRSMIRHFVDFIEKHDISLISVVDVVFAACDSLVKYAKGEVIHDPASEILVQLNLCQS